MRRELRIKTFDKVQGWQTLQTCATFESARKRVEEILEQCPTMFGKLRIVDEEVQS